MVRRILAAVLSVLLWTETVAADVVVLLDGRQYNGTVVNRDQLRQSPGSIQAVQIRMAPSDSLREFRREEIDVVVLEDSTGQRERIELAKLADKPPTMVPITPPISESGTHPGLKWMVGGAALLAFGLAVKLGEAEPEPGLQPLATEKTYNWVNYTAMAAGSGLIVKGAVMERRARQARTMQTGVFLSPSGPGFAVSMHF